MKGSTQAEKLINYRKESTTKTGEWINSSFTNSFMNSMFKDTSLNVAQRQKETMIRDQHKKVERELRRKQ